MKEMPTAQFYSEKKLILDMIDDAIKLAGELKNIPQTKDMIDDFKKLTKQISDIRPLK
jgi:hypothetical protein